MKSGITFTLRAVPKRRAVGKRARRQAFYARRRDERKVNRLFRAIVAPLEVSDHYLDALICGQAWLESVDGGRSFRRVAPFDALLQGG